jgi:FkbM family methyltransferase
MLREYIDPNRNILEIGGHCGTSTLVYASFLNDTSKIHVYEPQQNMYKLLTQNVMQNNLQHKITPINAGVFCYEGTGKMNDIDLDGGGGTVSKRYAEESDMDCNFGGIGLGKNGEDIVLTTIDNMVFDNIGFIHCDAQGAENFIFSKGIETIRKNRPVILYEDNETHGRYLYNNVCKSYPNYVEEGKFNIKTFCMEQLQYSGFIDRFNGGIDTLLIP